MLSGNGVEPADGGQTGGTLGREGISRLQGQPSMGGTNAGPSSRTARLGLTRAWPYRTRLTVTREIPSRDTGHVPLLAPARARAGLAREPAGGALPQPGAVPPKAVSTSLDTAPVFRLERGIPPLPAWRPS